MRGPREFLRELVHARSGVNVPVDRDYVLDANLATLLRDSGLATLDELVEAIRRDSSWELADRAVDRILNHETLFFRDIAPFDALRGHILPALLPSRSEGRPVRLWSAACSSGQEPFSLALLLRNHFPGAPVEILASDISSEMLARAATGRFTLLEANRGLPAALLARWFRRDGAGFVVDPSVRALVEFRRINLIEPWEGLEPMDAIFLRNVLLYMQEPTRRAVLRDAARHLAPGGVLFLGAAETMLPAGEPWEQVKIGEAFAFRPLEARP